jgi:hypothetical protein
MSPIYEFCMKYTYLYSNGAVASGALTTYTVIFQCLAISPIYLAIYSIPLDLATHSPIFSPLCTVLYLVTYSPKSP